MNKEQLNAISNAMKKGSVSAKARKNHDSYVAIKKHLGILKEVYEKHGVIPSLNVTLIYHEARKISKFSGNNAVELATKLTGRKWPYWG